MPVKVSVVVPVFNPGEHLATSVDSLLAQTLPRDEVELIFVDDGSTDGTSDLLDQLAEEHSQVRVIHEPGSGWSGRPRNVGLDAAVGEYVLFVDQDDRLGEQALSRMHAMALRNGSDIVIGKMVGVRRGVPVQLFRRSWDNATIHDSPIMDSLTPHKMFRRSFLSDANIRFPEGPRRLEDHVFVVAAYFAASCISVLSDYACYYHIARQDRGNASYRPLEPRGYLANLAEAIDIVDAHTEPGPARDRLHRRWLRVELVGRLRGAKLLKKTPDFREDFLREARALVQSRFCPGVDAGLLPMERLVAGLLRAGDLASLLQLAQWESTLTLQAELSSAQWQDGVLVVNVSTVLVDGAENPVELKDHNGTRSLVTPLPAEVLEVVPGDTLDVGEAVISLDIFARHIATRTQLFLTGTTAVQDDPGLRSTTTAELPASWCDSETEPPVDGGWEIFARWRGFGWTFSPAVIASAPAAGTLDPFGGPALIGAAPRLATPRRTPRGHLRVELATVSTADPLLAPTLHLDRKHSAVSARRGAATLDLAVHLATDRRRDVRVHSSRRGSKPDQIWSATLDPVATSEPGAALSRLAAAIPRRALAPGQWALSVSPPDVDYPLPVACRLVVRRTGSMRLRDHPAPTYRARLLALLPADLAEALRSLRRHAASTRRRLPA